MILLKAIIILIGILMAWRDLRYRELEWFLFPLLLGCIVVDAYVNNQLHLKNILINGGFLIVQLGLLILWIYISKREWLMKKEKFIGWGDILFFVILIFCFSPLNFVVFYLGSLLIILVLSIFFRIITLKKVTVPLAGGQAGLFSIMVITELLFDKIHFYSDDFWLQLINL